jgi:hypothetical protein
MNSHIHPTPPVIGDHKGDSHEKKTPVPIAGIPADIDATTRTACILEHCSHMTTPPIHHEDETRRTKGAACRIEPP